MKTFRLQTVQNIPITLEEAWAFFSDPNNLNKITPKEMKFEILDALPDKVYPGMIIRYRLSPMPGFRLNWVTEITQVSENSFFIDDQRVGPYRMWHHQHLFRSVEGGTEMTDILTYALPFGWLGTLLGAGFVRGKVRAIFNYREKALMERFGSIS